ncbi:TetR/AcrR family transcriptional regulator [Cryptosporangium sp. NPDC048952]|uniref:TetR/AcrR family transcriptional regulator n=1 Tax=Cryptosporangium sp. NPDC048952 TaxID=3363961 RepID=UPI00371393E7
MTLTRKGQATRDRILQSAAELIAARGVAGTSTEDVRRAAGVSGSQLYHYFDSKQALIRAVIARQSEEPPVPGQPIMGALDSYDALRAWCEAAIEHLDEQGVCSLASLAGELTASDEETREDLYQAFLRWQELISNGLRAMRERGELRADADLDELALALLTAWQGGVVLAQTMRSSEPLKASFTAALAYVRSFITVTL